MGKTPERRVFTSTSATGSLRYRRKVPDNQHDNQQPEAPPQDVKKEPPQPQQQQLKQHKSNNTNSNSNTSNNRSSRSPAGRRFRSKPRQLKQQLLWKAKAVQPTPAPQSSKNEPEEEDEEAAFAAEQRQTRKLLAREAEVMAKNKNKAEVLGPETFVAESSSQETQSGSEDEEVVFLPYRNLPTTKWQVFKQQEDESTDGEETTSPVMPSETVEQQQDQDGLEKAATHRKQRQKYKLKQKQKRAAAKEQKRRQHQQKHENEQPRVAEEDAASTQGDENATVDIFHPHTNLASEKDEGVCRAVLSQLKEVVPFIVVGDVACPVVADHDELPSVTVSASGKGQISAPKPDVAIVDFRQHVIAMLDRSKETQMQYRDSFVMQESGFDAASSYDFFKHRFCEIQRSEGIVYY